MKMKFNLGFTDNSKAVRVTKALPSKYYFGREIAEHAIMQLFMTDGENEYEHTIPVMLQEGVEWEFRRDESREVTEDDQRTHWNELLTRFPAYTGATELSQEAVDEFVGWLKSGTAETLIIPKGVTTDRNGVEHRNCVIVRPLGETSGSATPPPAPAKKAAKIPPKATAKRATREDAWAAYAGGKRIQTDPHGERFNDACDDVIGHDSSDATPEEWGRCVEAFSAR